MRIIAGQNRGVRLATIGKGEAGAHLRPTTDRVRESLFNILTHRLDFSGLRVLDLFAGTGALGLEALSRGAAHCTFVENGRVAAKLVTENISLTRQNDYAAILRCDATKLPKGTPCDLVFLDPPYGKDLGKSSLESAVKNGWLAPGCFVVWEEESPMSHPSLTPIDQRKFGNTFMSILTLS